MALTDFVAGQVLTAQQLDDSFAAVDWNENVIINGAMQVAQYGTTSAFNSGAKPVTADRFAVYNDIGAAGTVTVENDAPTGSGFRKSMKVLYTAAAASPAGAMSGVIFQYIEGQNLQLFRKGTADAKTFVVSFWVKSNVTGNYVVQLRDRDNNRSVSALYTINASATWEKKTITFPKDTTGTFDNDNGGSLQVIFFQAAGTGYTSGTLQTTWGAHSDATSAAGQTNLAAAINNYWQFTGVQVQPERESQFAFLDYGTVFAQCQRYFETQDWQANRFRLFVSYVTSATANSYIMYQPKRATPSFAWSANGSARYVYNGGNVVGSQTLTADYSSYNGTSVSTSSTFASSTGWVDSAGTLSISAEL